MNWNDYLKLMGLLIVYVSAIVGLHEERKIINGKTEYTKRGKLIILLSSLGLMITITVQISEAVKSSQNETLETERYENIAGGLDEWQISSESINEIAFIFYLKDSTFNLSNNEISFYFQFDISRGNNLRINAKIPGEKLININREVGNVTIDSGDESFAKARLFAGDFSIQQDFEFLKNSGKSIWLYMKPFEIEERAYKERGLWINRREQAKYPSTVSFPFKKIGDFKGVSFSANVEGLRSEDIQTAMIRLNRTFISKIEFINSAYESNSYSDSFELYKSLKSR